jgi:hypothetical protein
MKDQVSGRIVMIRHGLAIAALAIAAAAGPCGSAQADPYRWCADYTVMGGIGARNCYFMTIEQCRATVSGVGGLCVLNPFYDGVPVDGPKATRRTKRQR